MIKHKKIIVAIALALTVMLLGACAAPAEAPKGQAQPFDDELLTPGKIVVGTSPDYPPYESLDENGDYIGFDIDLIRILGEKLGVEVEFVSISFEMIISSLQAGQVDIGVSAFTYEEGRDVIFSTPYIESAQVVLVRTDSGITTLDDLKGKKISAGLGTTGAKTAAEIENADVATVDDYQMAFELLKNGQVDAVVSDIAVAKNYAAQDGLTMLEEPLLDENVSVIIKNGNDKLAAAINAAIADFITTDEYKALLAKWELG